MDCSEYTASMSAGRTDSAPLERNPKLKRSRDEIDSNNDESKKRGRPRLTTQDDESTADKRRSQIRLAQRAYRQRKEDTISELRQQVAELQSTIQSMNKTFSNFAEKWSAINTPPAMLAELQSVAQKYSAGQNRVDSLDFIKLSETDSFGTDTTTDASSKEKDRTFLADGSNISPRTAVKQATFSPMIASIDATDSPEHIENSRVSISMLHSLGLPASYSSFERTFARRLHRASCEYAYRLACDPARYPVPFNNVFKLTLRAAGTIERVKYSLESTLSRSIREPLSNWGVTYIHVGGAGTHYPRPPEEGGLSYQSPNSWAVTTVGPHRIGGSTIEEALTAEMLLRGVIGIDGQFYDAYDVEGYLVEKGIHLDPGATYAQIELPDDGSFSADSSVASSPTDPTTATAYVRNLAGSEAFAHPRHTACFSGFPNVEHIPSAPDSVVRKRSYAETQMQLGPQMNERRSTASLVGQSYGAIPMADDIYAYPFQPLKKKRFTIDVGKFVEEMSLAGTCLMRAPGYRRKDVDIALRRAVVSAH